jgi:hypothetical protein
LWQLPTHITNHFVLPGGYSTVPLKDADKNIDFYLRTQIPELAPAELT